MHIKDIIKQGKTLSTELHELAEEFKHHAVRLEEVIAVLQERAYTLLIIILALPFCAPVSVPGLSTPLGLVIAIVAGRFALNLPPWLPRRLMRTELPPRFFRQLLEGASKVIGLIERVLRPRLLIMTATPRLVRLHALMVCIAACALLIPAPIPFSNLLPAIAIILGAAGVMERDGLAIIGGYFFAIIGITYFVLVALMGAQAWDFIRNKLAGVV